MSDSGRSRCRAKSGQAPGTRGTDVMRPLTALLLLVLSPVIAVAEADPFDGPVARVNGRPIPRSEFEMAVQLQFNTKHGNRVGVGELRATREKVLDRLIDGELLYQRAIKQTVKVKEKDVTAEVEKIRGRFESEEAFLQTLRTNATSEQAFRAQVRRSLIITRFLDREVLRGVRVSDEDVRLYYDQHPAETKRREAVPIRQILIRIDPNGPGQTRAAAREKIEAILSELRAGSEFEEMARRYSEGEGASEGGDRGILIRGAGAPPLIARAAFSLAAGEISDVIETRQGFHLLKVGERRPAGIVPFDEAKDRIRARLESTVRDEAVRAYVDSLRGKAAIERLLPE